MPRVADSLAGRMEVVTLVPFAQAEVQGTGSVFLEATFAGQPPAPGTLLVGRDLVQAVIGGGYPEMLTRSDPRRRATWARDYIRAIVERDVRDVAEIDKLEQMPPLLRALAQHAGRPPNSPPLTAPTHARATHHSTNGRA